MSFITESDILCKIEQMRSLSHDQEAQNIIEYQLYRRLVRDVAAGAGKSLEEVRALCKLALGSCEAYGYVVVP